MNNISQIIKEAEYLLKNNHYDAFHNLAHHQRVWKNAEKIVAKEKLDLDIDALKVACFWHDVVLEEKNEKESRQVHIDETLNYLSGLMRSENFTEKFQSIVVNAIRDHGFEKKKQLNIEGEVLFDADKLDALNPERYRKIVDSLKKKKLSKFKIVMYKQAAKLWLRTMRNRYHFETSKEIHDEKILALLDDTETIEAAKAIGIDIPKLLK